VEAIPGDFDVLFPEKGLLAHANHFTSLRLLQTRDRMIKKSSTDTYFRMRTMKERLERLHGKITAKRVQGILTDHAEYPTSICRHEEPEAEWKSCTIFSVIMNLNKREMHLAMGPPCRNKYFLYQ
jgi:isopenicillin-N N-acyltransferase-like protein